jgi:hypothetical protein
MILGIDSHRTHDHIVPSDGSGSLHSTSSPLVFAHTQSSKLCYDWQSVGVEPRCAAQDLIFVTVISRFLGVGHLSFTIAAGPRKCSHSWVQVLQDSWPYFTVSDLGLPQPGGPGPRIHIPRNRVAQLHPLALGSRFVTSYNSQGYGGGIWTC